MSAMQSDLQMLSSEHAAFSKTGKTFVTYLCASYVGKLFGKRSNQYEVIYNTTVMDSNKHLLRALMIERGICY